MKTKRLDKFLGLHNTADATTLPLEALSVADNVLITDYGDVAMRPGYSLVLGATSISGSYGVSDNSAMYFVEQGTLYKFDGVANQALVGGISTSTLFWCEESTGLVFLASEGSYLRIDDGQVVANLVIPKLEGLTVQLGGGNIPRGEALIAAQYRSEDGLYGPMSEVTSVKSATDFNMLVTVPEIAGYVARIVVFLPDEGVWVPMATTKNFAVIDSIKGTGGVIPEIYFEVVAAPLKNVVAAAYYMSRVVLATQIGIGVTRIHFSLPQTYHLFSSVEDYFDVPDVVTGMESVGTTLLITGEHGIHTYSQELGYTKIANYGTPKGKPITKLPEGGCYVWTKRGVCSYPDFVNHTETKVSLPPGNGASTALFDYGGSRYILCCTDGAGVGYNALR